MPATTNMSAKAESASETFQPPPWARFHLRNKASRDRIHNLIELLYNDISRDLLTNLGLSKTGKQLALTAFTVLRSLPSALALERRLNPGTCAAAPLRRVLKTVFEAMVTVGQEPKLVETEHDTAKESTIA